MKMQDVIVELRTTVPLMDKQAQEVDGHYERATSLMRDLQRVSSAEAASLLLVNIISAMKDFSKAYTDLRVSVESMVMLNNGYKEKIGPRAKKPKDAEGQQMLPGLGDEDGTPTTMGETSTTGCRTPSFIQSGRHG
jgi:hypothetical protein